MALDHVKRLPTTHHRENTLTWNRHKELDGISVTMETQLCLGHGAVGDEAPVALLCAVISIHMDHAPRRCGRHLIGYKHTVITNQCPSSNETAVKTM